MSHLWNKDNLPPHDRWYLKNSTCSSTMWLCPSPSGEVYFPSSWIREGIWPFPPMEYSRSDAMRIARLGHKRKTAFTLFAGHIWTCSGPERPLLRVVMLGNRINQQGGHMQYLHQPRSRHVSEKTFRWFQPPTWVTPNFKCFLTEALDIIEAELTIPCALSEFLTHRTYKYKNMVADNKLGTNSNWKKHSHRAIVTGKTTTKTALNFK